MLPPQSVTVDYCDSLKTPILLSVITNHYFPFSGRMAASGVPVAAADTVWYKWLDKRYQGASTKMALRKAGVDFVLGAPLLNMVWLTSEFSMKLFVV